MPTAATSKPYGYSPTSVYGTTATGVPLNQNGTPMLTQDQILTELMPTSANTPALKAEWMSQSGVYAPGTNQNPYGIEQGAVAQPTAAPAKQTVTQPSLTSQIDTAAGTVIADLNKNNFAGAWQTALATSPLYSTNYGAQTTDPLLAALESSTGLKELDPTKVWTKAETDAYYAALQANPVFHGQTVTGAGGGKESLGQDPYGLWGSAAGITSGSDAAANISQEGLTPDVGRFAGAKPSTSFLSKYGPDIAALALAVAAPEAIPAIEGAIGATGVVGAAEAGALYGAGAGAIKGAVSGGNIGKDALVGAAVGGVGAGVGSELSSIGTPQPITNIATGLGKAEVGGLVSGALTSPSGQGTGGAGGTTLSPGVAPAVGAAVSATIDPNTGLPTTGSGSGSSTTGSSFGSDLLTGLETSLGGTSLGGVIGGMAPYLAVAGVGLEQAKTGEAQAANYSATQQKLAQPSITASNTLLSNYNQGIINPVDAAASKTEIAQGNKILSDPNLASLSSIAATAFSDYNSGTLKPGDQLQLDQSTQAAKQGVAAQLAAAGITDSSVLSGQYQQIDNNAQIQKQTILNGYFATGNTAYDKWLTTTQAGNAAIVAGQKIASDSLQTELTNSMAEANIGIGEMNTAIQTQMTTDAAYAAQVSQLLGTLATAYAKSVAAGNTTNVNVGGGGAGGTQGGGAGAGAPGGSVPLSSTGPMTPLGATNAAGSAANVDPSLSGDIAAQTIPATATNPLDIQAAGQAGLSDLTIPNVNIPGDATGSGSVPYIINSDGTMTDPMTGAVISGSSPVNDVISGNTSSWLSDLGGSSYYG